MASSKAEFVPGGEAPAPTLLSGSGGLAASSTAAAARPEAQTRKPNRSRTSAFLSNTILRPRGKSVSNTLVNDWDRPVGGSEGLGSIYNSAMNSRERSQVLRSLTTLEKDSDNDVTGAAAEAFSGNATPSIATRSRFFASFRTDSSSSAQSGQTIEAPPSYQTDQRPEPRRGSEGSVVSHISLPGHESASSRSSISQNWTSRRASFYFGSAASSTLASSATSSGSISLAASPAPGSVLAKQQQQQQQSQSQRQSSGQFSAAARQAFRPCRSFLALPNGISEDDDWDAIHRYFSNGSSDGADNNTLSIPTELPTKAKASPKRESLTHQLPHADVASNAIKAIASTTAVVDNDEEDCISSSRSKARWHDAGGGENLTANVKARARATGAGAGKQLPAEAGHDAVSRSAASSLASKFEAGNGRPIGNANLTNRRDKAEKDDTCSLPLILNNLSRVQEIPGDVTPASGPSASKQQQQLEQHAAETHQKQQHDALSCFSDSAAPSAFSAASSAAASAADSFAPSDVLSDSLSQAKTLSLSLGPGFGSPVLRRSHSQVAAAVEPAAQAEPESFKLHSQQQNAQSTLTAAQAPSSSSTAIAAIATVTAHAASPSTHRLSSSAFTAVPPPPPPSPHCSSPPPVASSCTSSSSVLGADIAPISLVPIPSLSTSSSTINVTTTAAATVPSQSTLKLAYIPNLSSSQLATTQLDHIALPTTAPFSSQHDLSLHSNPHLNSTDQSSRTQLRRTQPQAVSSSTAVEPSSSLTHSDNHRCSLPPTPPTSLGPCISPRTSVSGARDSRTGLPSPASSTHGSATGLASRRGSGNEPTGILVNGYLFSATGPSPRTSVAFTDDVGPRPTVQSATSPPSSTGRVSFDLRHISLFGGSSAATKMSSNAVSSASFAGIGNGQPPNTSDANGRHQTSSQSASASKFFSRISLPGSSRRGSAADASPLSSPQPKPRSRFSSFGRLASRGSDAPTSSPNRNRGLPNSMQPWASASTDVLGMRPAANQGRNSLTLAREEATRPRKSLHLPPTNLIDLDFEDNSDTTATTSTATHRIEPQALPPIETTATTAILNKPEKPASPSLNLGRRPSFNFLRRASATSTNPNVDNVNGERRGSRGSTHSFARTFMNRTLSRNSKTSDTPPATARGISSPNGDSASPIFRHGIFDTRSSVTPDTVAYPGMSSTVNWNALGNARRSNQAELAPGEVDPTVAIPLYPESVASGAVPTQPKAVTDLATGVLAEPRPSHGIDQEQDAGEASNTIPESLSPTAASTTTTAAPATTFSPGQSTDSLPSRQRPARSCNVLSHLPRLNSMRTVAGTTSSSQGNSNGHRVARTGSESTTAGETSEGEQEASEDEDEFHLTGQTSDYHDMGTETDDETDDDPSPAVSRRVLAAHMAATGSSGGLNCNRPTESLILPPAPSFIPNPSSSLAEQDADATPSTSSAPGTSNGLFNQNVGRDSWTNFNAAGFTPFETPTSSYGGSRMFAAPTPRARQEQSESSYFAARPVTSNRNRATTAGTMSGDAPPPSPSIISRSRAPSSASMRTMRTPGSGSMTSGPVPTRTMPTPGGALPPLVLHRQIQAASGSTRSGIDRSKSPGLAAGSSRPSTSGILTPHQTPAGDRMRSREPSIDRPAFERPSSPATASIKASTRQIVGLDGMAVSTVAPPSLYQQKSKSLVDLLGPASRRLEIDTAAASRPIIVEPSPIEAQRRPITPRLPSETSAYSKKDGLAPINTSGTSAASIASPSLGRRRSMFEMRAEPPPYSIIHNRPDGPQVILPREEEGNEKLPMYYCGVHIEGYLPRKMEFSAPGVQAKDRSWKRQYFVLHGTSLRVYKNDLSVDRHAASGSWGEMMGVHVHLEPMNEDGSNGSGSSIGLGAAAREAISHTPLGNHRNEAFKNKEAGTQFDSKNGLIRNYTLQGAESGLAADYLKRHHVVRVRAEGEQFLLQTRSDRHVVDWIEALQAATNVAMDLEKRPMPKFITLPRRRRRRRRNADGTVISPEEQERRDLAEAQRQSIAEAGGRLNVGEEATPRESISQSGRAGMSIENELNPSAAFERMLREDQEKGGRQSAEVL